MTILERVIDAGRPFQIKGKGFLLNPFTPHAGSRQVVVAGPYRMTLDLSNAIHRQIFMGCFAREMTTWAKTVLATGGTFLDIGAHAGYFSLLASSLVGPGGRVYAIEPNPRTFASLKEHLSLNGVDNVQAAMFGLADASGAMALHMPPSCLDYNATVLPRDEWTRVEIPTRTLDECVREWGVERVDLMKIDVEGAEPLVLAGGAGALERGVVRHAMIEINGPRLSEGGSGPGALAQTLDRLGFAPASLVGGRAIPKSWDTFDTDPTHETDCLFVHRRTAR